MPKISIILPVHNAGERIIKCLDTLVNQSLRDIEIILVLDCPTDGSDKIAKQYAENDDRIIIIENKTNLHIGESRNKGLEIAKGEYIGFSDHDDYRELTMYEELYNAAEKEKVDVVLGTSVCIGIQNEILNFPPDLKNEELRDFALRNLIEGGNDEIRTPLAAYIHPNIYKRELLCKNKMFFVDTFKVTPEDVIFQIMVLFYAKKVIFYNKSLYYHILHASSTGHNLAYKTNHTRAEGKNIIYHFLMKNNCYDVYKKYFLRSVKKEFTNNLLDFLYLNKNIYQFFCTMKFLKSFPFSKDAFRNAVVSLNNYRWGGKFTRRIVFLLMRI